MSGPNQPPGVLVLARSYPNAELPILGIWAERLTEASTEIARPVVISPVGYVPPGMPVDSFARFRRIPKRDERRGIPIRYPRVPALPGYTLHTLDARLSYPFVRRAAEKLAREHDIRLIHAHFIYPEGVIAARLGRRLGIPVVTTEHAWWTPWMERYASVRRQVLKALPHIRLITAVSDALRRTIVDVAGPDVRVDLLPNMVDEDVFVTPDGSSRDPDRVLFVGVVRHVKGLDILVRAMPHLMRRRPGAHLVVVGDPFFRQYQKDTERVQALVRELGLEERVRFTGGASPAEVAEHMRNAAVLAIPSRRESFPTVTLEALATGTPVVATRCGGPEEILDERVGRLVPVEDPVALAEALGEVMARPAAYPPEVLRTYCIKRWGREATVERLRSVYWGAIGAGDAHSRLSG